MKPTEIGDKLTIKSEIVDIGGHIIFSEGQTVEVLEVVKRGGFYGKNSGVWIDRKIVGVKLVGESGIWFPSCFVEELFVDKLEKNMI
jgi:hypothetical protein